VDAENFMMTITDLKNRFQKELLSIYQREEIATFFYLLTEHRLGLKRLDIALDPNATISSINEQFFLTNIGKLKKEIPIQYIIGETEFFGQPFYVNQDVLIPRPETEELVQLVIQKTKEKREENKEKTIRIIDIGTGSGCIAISLAKNIPNASVWALDISEKALKVAKKNAQLNNVNIQFLKEDVLWTNSLPIKFDIIVSNPPYVRELEKNQIKNNVLENEPPLALYVKNEDALIFYDKIADLAKDNLNQNGQIFFEINQYLGRETVALLKSKGFQNIELKKDIFGNDRMVKADLDLQI